MDVIIDEAVDELDGDGGYYEDGDDDPMEVVKESQVVTYQQAEAGNEAMVWCMRQEGMPDLAVHLVDRAG